MQGAEKKPKKKEQPRQQTKRQPKIRLSIVIPYYNAKEYTDELLDVLAKQMIKGVEVILVDDGSIMPYETKYKGWIKVIRKENGGCASARNVGIDKAAGDYISFIDADDMIPDYFIEKILEKTKEKPYDVIDFSWRSLSSEGAQFNRVVTSDDKWLPNPSVCTRAFKRSFIGNNRFNEIKDTTEDEDFSRKVGYLDHSKDFVHGSIPEYMYFYRTAVTNSKSKRFRQGLMKTKRITYYYPAVTKNMTALLEEIKKEDECNEVWLLTNKCEIPELKRYCQIAKPFKLWTHYLRGEHYTGATVITPPLKSDVVVYVELTNPVGGIGTFIYNFCSVMHDKVDIIVLHDRMDPAQVRRLEKLIRVVKNEPSVNITCDTIICNRLFDKIPAGVTYKKSVQINHACKLPYLIPQRDYNVNVSQAAKDSWGSLASDAIVIHNIVNPEPTKKILKLVSATRMGCSDKGQNDNRFRKLAQMLDKSGIPWLWLNFSDKPLRDAPSRFVNMKPELSIQNYIKEATYLVQLSDEESFSYSIVEALSLKTPVICTNMPVLSEIGVVDGVNAHVVPFNLDFDVKTLLEVPEFEYSYDNTEAINKWMEIFKAEPVEKPKKELPDVVNVVVVKGYYDIQLQATLKTNQTLAMRRERALQLANRKPRPLVRILEG